MTSTRHPAGLDRLPPHPVPRQVHEGFLRHLAGMAHRASPRTAIMDPSAYGSPNGRAFDMASCLRDAEILERAGISVFFPTEASPSDPETRSLIYGFRK